MIGLCVRHTDWLQRRSRVWQSPKLSSNAQVQVPVVNARMAAWTGWQGGWAGGRQSALPSDSPPPPPRPPCWQVAACPTQATSCSPFLQIASRLVIPPRQGRLAGGSQLEPDIGKSGEDSAGGTSPPRPVWQGGRFQVPAGGDQQKPSTFEAFVPTQLGSKIQSGSLISKVNFP